MRSLIISLILAGCSPKYYISHISDSINGDCLVTFRNDRIERALSVLDTCGTYEYSKKRYTESQIREFSR